MIVHVQKGDTVRLFTGATFEAVSNSTTLYFRDKPYATLVSVHIKQWFIPVHGNSITHVYRNGALVWSVDMPRQLPLFADDTSRCEFCDVNPATDFTHDGDSVCAACLELERAG